MKRNYKALSIGCIGVIVIGVTLAMFFLLSFEKTQASWLAFVFIMISEIVLFAGMEALVFIDNLSNKLFIRLGTIVVLSLYFAATIIMSLFANAFKNHVNVLITIEILIMAVAAVVMILLIVFSMHINGVEQKVSKDVNMSKRGGY